MKEARDEGLILFDLAEPRSPGVVHLVEPEVGKFSEVDEGLVKRSAEGVVCQIDPWSAGGAGKVGAN